VSIEIALQDKIPIKGIEQRLVPAGFRLKGGRFSLVNGLITQA
jgi:hypothetical protein